MAKQFTLKLKANKSTSTRKHNTFTLPLKLREQIYEYAFTTEPLKIRNFETVYPGILRASKAVRHEVLPYFYTNTIFRFTRLVDIMGWLSELKPGCKEAITKIEYIVEYDGALDTQKYLAEYHDSVVLYLKCFGIELRDGVMTVRFG